jgi:hypothetical protein
MAIIPDDLSEQVSKNPSMDYSVLITLKEDGLPSALLNKGKFIMDNKIYSARISGAEIQSLRNDTKVEAIEPDMEMGIL